MKGWWRSIVATLCAAFIGGVAVVLVIGTVALIFDKPILKAADNIANPVYTFENTVCTRSGPLLVDGVPISIFENRNVELLSCESIGSFAFFVDAIEVVPFSGNAYLSPLGEWRNVIPPG